MYQWRLSFTKYLFPTDAFFDRAIGRHPISWMPDPSAKAHSLPLKRGFWPVFRFWPRLYDYVSRIITKCACISVIINIFFFGYTINPCIDGLYIIWRKKSIPTRGKDASASDLLTKGVPRMHHICMFARSSVTRSIIESDRCEWTAGSWCIESRIYPLSNC